MNEPRTVAVAAYKTGQHRAPWQAAIVRIPWNADFPREVIWRSNECSKSWQEAQQLATVELMRREVSEKNSSKKSIPAMQKLKVYNLDDV